MVERWIVAPVSEGSSPSVHPICRGTPRPVNNDASLWQVLLLQDELIHGSLKLAICRYGVKVSQELAKLSTCLGVLVRIQVAALSEQSLTIISNSTEGCIPRNGLSERCVSHNTAKL